MHHITTVMLHFQDGEGTVIGARCRDMETGQEFDVQAKCVVNAGGPLSDGLRKYENATFGPPSFSAVLHPVLRAESPLLQAGRPDSAANDYSQQRGSHHASIILQARHAASCPYEIRSLLEPQPKLRRPLRPPFSPEGLGLIVPKTKDGRVVFLLPWMGATIAGTTDNPVEVTAHPRPTTAEVDYILKTLSGFLSIQVSTFIPSLIALLCGRTSHCSPSDSGRQARRAQQLERHQAVGLGPDAHQH